MKALVVYDSLYGNTEKIAQAIAATLGSQAEVSTLRVGDARPQHLAGLSLLLAGTPTNGGRISKPTDAWLKTLTANCLRGVKVAAFDTRVPLSEVKGSIATFFVKLIGYHAGSGIATSLTKRGGTLAIQAEGFGVKGTKGPLVEGELERAAAWAQQILARV